MVAHLLFGVSASIADAADAGPDSISSVSSGSRAGGSAIDVELSVYTRDVITPDFQGVGAELDPFGFMPENEEAGFDEKDWRVLSDRIKRADFDIVRMWYQPDWHEPDNDDADPSHINWDGFVFDSERMKSVYRYLDLCESVGCKVNLVFGWKRGKPHHSWLCFSEDVEPTESAPSDLDEWAESVSALLSYLFDVKKYTCVQYLTSFNEPNSSDDFEVPAGYDEKDWYGRMYKKIHERLAKDGIRHRIKLVAPDEAHDSAWLDYSIFAMDEVIDAYAGHFHTNDPGELADFCDAWVKKISAAGSAKPKNPDKPFYLSEFGGVRDAALRDSYEHGLILADLVITALNHGARAMTRWRASDIYLVSPIAGSHDPDDLIYHGLQRQGLWGYRDTGWMPRYSYYAYSLITKYTDADSSVLKTRSTHPDVSVSALRSPEGSYTILLLNKGEADARVSIVFEPDSDDIEGLFGRHIYDSNLKPSPEAFIILSGPAVELTPGFSDLIPAKTFVVYEQTGTGDVLFGDTLQHRNPQ